MRTSITFFLVFIISSISSVFGQSVPEVQRPLLSKVSADWCPPCGSWGWNFFEELVSQNEDKATLIVAHHDGGLTNTVAQNFTTNFESPYQPYFYYYLEDQDVNSTNAAARLTQIKAKVDANWTTSPIANAGIDLTFDGEDLTVKTKTKFFQDADGEFYLGVYFIENEVIAYQASQGNNANHEKILRGAISEGSFGELLDQGAISAGTEYEHTFDADLTNFNMDHLEVITIIWQKVGNKFHAVNSNISTDFVNISAVKNPRNLLNTSLSILPNIVNSSSVIEVNSSQSLSEVQLKVVDMNGVSNKTIYKGKIAAGISSFYLQTEQIATGNYILLLETKQGALTKKFVIQ